MMPELPQSLIPQRFPHQRRLHHFPHEQHLHRLLLEFFGVDASLRPVRLVGLDGTRLGCLVGVNLSSRSVHKSPYTSLFLFAQDGENGCPPGKGKCWDRARNQSQFRASEGSHPKGSPFVVSFLRAFLKLFPSLSTSGLRGRFRLAVLLIIAGVVASHAIYS
jgi:hypothetical protein